MFHFYIKKTTTLSLCTNVIRKTTGSHSTKCWLLLWSYVCTIVPLWFLQLLYINPIHTILDWHHVKNSYTETVHQLNSHSLQMCYCTLTYYKSMHINASSEPEPTQPNACVCVDPKIVLCLTSILSMQHPQYLVIINHLVLKIWKIEIGGRTGIIAFIALWWVKMMRNTKKNNNCHGKNAWRFFEKTIWNLVQS